MWLLRYSWEGWQALVGQGGVLIYALLLVSIAGLAIILEKLIVLRRERLFHESAAVSLLLAIKRGKKEQIDSAKKEAPLPMAEIVSSAQLVAELPKEDMLSEMASVASLHVRNISRRVRMLGILAQISPLIGLLGTVIGMIRAMGEVSIGAGADPMAVGQGISQALITTAVGLSIGIPFLVVHSYFRNRVNHFAAEFEEFSHEVMKAFHYPDSVVLERPRRSSSKRQQEKQATEAKAAEESEESESESEGAESENTAVAAEKGDSDSSKNRSESESSRSNPEETGEV